MDLCLWKCLFICFLNTGCLSKMTKLCCCSYSTSIPSDVNYPGGVKHSITLIIVLIRVVCPDIVFRSHVGEATDSVEAV